LYKTVRLWLSLEAIFFVYYLYKHRQLQALAPNPMPLKPGKPREIFSRISQVIYDIQAGGRTLGHPSPCTPQRGPSQTLGLTPPRMTPQGMTPSGSALDLPGLLGGHERNESNLEELLRQWDCMDRTSSFEIDQTGPHSVENAFSAAERAVLERSVIEAEVKALKHAEVSGWFLERRSRRRWPASRLCEIGQDNIAEFLAWAFFHCEPKEMPLSRSKEFKELVEMGRDWAEVDFPPGYNPEVQCMRLTMDSIQSIHRPLIYYGLTNLVLPAVTERLLAARGFSRQKSGSMTYWYRPGMTRATIQAVSAAWGASIAAQTEEVSSGPCPFVFCHGIGINVLPYVSFVDELLANSATRDVFLVSMPHISMRLKEDVPSSSEMVACLSDMLTCRGHNCGHFIGHSFGTVPLAWMVRRAPDMVKIATFIDPVCFLLVKPDVCYNFIYRRASTPARLVMEFFAARELYTAHSLSRNFFWSH
jgi:pimeloyl-ACP methyl ester carboxylesterase